MFNTITKDQKFMLQRIAPAIIAAGIMAAGTGANAFAQGKMNKKTRQWNEKMYGQQRADSLADWNMVNAYNSPAEQMARVKAAGINPHEAFGSQGITADPVRSTDVKSWDPKAANFDPSSTLGAYFDTKMQQQQLDNLKINNQLVAQEIDNKKYLQDQIKAQTDSITTDTAIKSGLSPYNLELTKGNVQKQMQEIAAKAQEMNLNLERNEREIARQTKDFEVATEMILKSRSDRETSRKQRDQIDAAIAGMKSDNVVKEFQARLAEKNINPNDPLWARSIAALIDFLMKKYTPEKGGIDNKDLNKENPSGTPRALDYFANPRY